MIFNAFQIALIGALVLTVKAELQGYDWYAYLPLAFLRPAALQIQGTVLALLCLAFVGLRLVVQQVLPNQDHPTRRLLDSRYTIDRLLVWILAGGFLLLAGYGGLSGIVQELGGLGSNFPGIDMARFPHQEAFGLGSWIVLGLLLLVMVGTFWERRRGIYLLGALATLSAVIPLLAGQFETQIATATAWRWLATAFFVVGSLLLWYRDSVSRTLAHLGWPALAGRSEAFVSNARRALIVLTVLPIVVFTITPAMLAVLETELRQSTNSLPLIVVALVIIGYARRERKLEFAFYAGGLFNLTVTLAFLLRALKVEGSFEEFVVGLLQVNALTLALYSIPWLATRGSWLPALNEHEARFANYLLKLQLGIAVALNVLLVLPIVAVLIVEPQTVGAATAAAGNLLGWLTLGVVVVGIAWLGANRTIRLSAYSLLGLLLTVCCLVAFGVSDISGWLGVHILTVCTALTAWLMLGVSEFAPDQTESLPFPINLLRRTFDFGANWQRHARGGAVIAGGISVFLSLRALEDAGNSRWWSIGPLLAITVLAATLNWKTLRRRYIYAAGILFSLAVSFWSIFIQQNLMAREWLLINLIAASLAGILWLCLELRARQLNQNVRESFSSFHHVVALCALSLLALFVLASFIVHPLQSPLLGSPLLSWFAFASLLLFLAACVWDKHAKYAIAGLYALGLIACAMVLHLMQLSAMHMMWSITIFLGAYSLFVTLLWHKREQIIALLESVGVPRRINSDTHDLAWLSLVTITVVATTAYLAFWNDLGSLDLGMRVSTSLAVAAQFLTFSLLAEGRQKQNWRLAAVFPLVIGAVLVGWAWLTPGVNATWFNRSVILMLEAFGLTALYGLLLDKLTARFPGWTSAARAFVPWLLAAGVVALFFCLGTEIWYQIFVGAVNIHSLALVAVGLTLVAGVVTCVLFALSPDHDPLGLSEHRRTRYVYVAEAMLALLFLHVRLTMPWLFTGFIERYWPLVVMVIAYFGVTASEALRRRKLLVLAHPLERTGAFLPLLPVLGFWLASSEVDFSLLLFIVGGLYGLLSILRRSFVFGIMAAVAGNAGLWYMWNRTADYQFFQHPQLWLIPVAMSVLIAAYLNEEKLSEDQMTGLRYLSLVTIYVSSTADIFINGVANSPWLPLILGAFALVGVFAGIVFRVRGLLLLGSIFLLLSITTMIWYASVNFGWTWLWYVAGIVTGATIIFMFAVFEKKRSEVLRVVEGLKDWER